MAKISLIHPRYWVSWLGMALLALLGQMPYAWVPHFGAWLGKQLMKIIKSRVQVTRRNLAACFPDRTSEERELLLQQVFASAGQGALETFIAWFRSRKSFARIPIDIVGLEYLSSSETGAGTLIIFPHLSMLELAGRAVAEQVKLIDVYQHASSPIFNAVMVSRRQRYFHRLINRIDLRDLVRALKNNENVVYLPDQDFGDKNSVFAPFFGVPTATATATARLAVMTGARVLIASCIRKRELTGFSYKITFKPMESFPTGDELIDATRINREIENVILEQPENYFWYHKRFKTRPPGMPSFY